MAMRNQATKPAKVDEADWSELQSALSSVSSPSFGVAPSQLNSVTPESLGNDPKLEEKWAESAAKHAMTYEKLLNSFNDKTKLRLTSIDTEIYDLFRATFPLLDISHLSDLDLKNEKQKIKWREFCMKYSNNSNIKDYHWGTLLRLNSEKGYQMETGGQNTTIVPRIQFLAIEIARNREGKNNNIK